MTVTRRSSTVAGIGSVLPQLPLWAALTRDQRQDLAAQIQDSRQRAAERRAAVLRYPDLVQRLMLAGIDPMHWNGFVPPRLLADSGRGQAVNTSLVRALLVDVAAEAWRRDRAANGERHLKAVA